MRLLGRVGRRRGGGRREVDRQIAKDICDVDRAMIHVNELDITIYIFYI